MNLQDTKMRSCSLKLPWATSQGHAMVNHKICEILQPDFNFGFGSRDSKSSPCRLPCKTRAKELSVAFEVLSDRSAERDSPIHLLTRSKDLSLFEISLKCRGVSRRLLQGLLNKCSNN